MHARPHIDARRIGMLEAKSGPARVAFTWLALASSGLALRSGALRGGSFSLAAGLACRCHGKCSFATAGHRLPGDLFFTLLSGLMTTASRRNLTNDFIAWREEPCSQSGSQARALAPVSSRLSLPMRLPSKRLLGHGTAPERQFLFSLHARLVRGVLPSSQGTLMHLCPALRPRLR